MARQWMPMYWGDYSRKTQHLSTLEHGAYLLLIAHYWNTGAALPNDDEVLRRITRTTTKQWNVMKATVKNLFTPVDNCLHHERVDEELEAARGVSTLQSSRAKQRWNNEQKQLPLDAAGINPAMPYHNHNHPSHNKPPLVTDPAKDVVLKNGFDIVVLLTDSGRAYAKTKAPGWDIYFLASIYNEKVRKGQWKTPNNPDAAFASWCGKYTKGRAPE